MGEQFSSIGDKVEEFIKAKEEKEREERIRREEDDAPNFFSGLAIAVGNLFNK